MVAAFRAYTNIALVKYWGKREEQLILPMNSSLSLTLDAFYTDTAVIPQKRLLQDDVVLDGQPLEGNSAERVRHFMGLVRAQAGSRLFAAIHSINHVPYASGFASSASGFAALAAAASQAYGLALPAPALSRLARRGSGSAARSIYGGFVVWNKGTDDRTSYAVPIDRADWGIRVIGVGVDRSVKKVSSREGMRRTVRTSPYYPSWISAAEKDLQAMKAAVYMHHLEQVGQLAEANALKMHAAMLAATPPLCYWEAGTVTAMRMVQRLRAAGFHCYFTIDAGPNVKILCPPGETKRLVAELSSVFPPETLTVAGPGPGVRRIESVE